MLSAIGDAVTLDRLRAVCQPLLDSAGFVPGAQADERYCTDWSRVRGQPLAVLRPRTTDEVSRLLTVLQALRHPVVLQGGMTGLTGACVPQGGEVVLSLERLRTIEEIDAVSGTVTVQAGVCLQALQQAVEARNLFFPVDIGSRGSCQVGGIIATNAGGNRVLRYGMTRQSVLGLEVVLADGTVISRMGKVLKDNAGYDLKHLFIGSEGTLGVITRALLALQPLPVSRQSALVTVAGFDAVTALLTQCRQRLGPRLSRFEVMWRDFFDISKRNARHGRHPEVLANGEVREHSATFRNGAETETSEFIGGCAVDDTTGQANLAGGGLQKPRHHLEDGGLSGAVGAKQRNNGTLRHRKADAVKHLDRAIGGANIDEFDQWGVSNCTMIFVIVGFTHPTLSGEPR